MDKTVVNKGPKQLTDAEYRRLRDYLVAKTGLNLQLNNSGELIQFFDDRLAGEFPDWSFDNYFDKLCQEGEGGTELRYLISRLTVGETHFFRNKPQINALRNGIIPELVKRKNSGIRTLKFWSAGCSTGEEAYTLAMILLESVPELDKWSISILATDINNEALTAARKGLYREWSFRDVDEYYQRRFFTRDKEGWTISRELVDMVSFRYLNLAEDLYPAAVTRTDDLDLIICRNVMIYFNVDLSLQITERFYHCLREGGYLVVGHSEHSEMVCPTFKRKLFDSAIFYRKGGAAATWEKGIKLRFRGSGRPTGTVLIQEERKKEEESRIQRPSHTEETVLFEEAAALYRKMMLDEARDLFTRIVRMNGDNLRARYMTALIAADCGDIEEAEQQSHRILQVAPLHLKAMYLLSLVYRIRGQADKEIEYLKKTVYINRLFVMGHFQMGVYYLNQGNERLARRSLNNVLDLLRGKEPTHLIEGVRKLTVEDLRKSVLGMYPGGPPEEYRDE